MLTTSTARSRRLINLVRACPLILGLGALLPVHAQEPGPASKIPLRGADKTPGPTTRQQDPLFRARWRAQQIAARRAEAEYNNARLAREIAEIALLEYEEGILAQDIATVDGEIKLAESDLSRAVDRLDWVRRMSEKRLPPFPPQKGPEELNLKKSRFALEQAQSKKKVLIEFTKPKTIKELKSEIGKARSNELAKKATWELEKSKESKLERYVGRPPATGAKPQ